MYSNFYKKNSHNAKVVQKIINSKSSTELKFEYTGDTKNNLPHTSKGHGKKKFEYVDEVRIKQLREQSQKQLDAITIQDLGLEPEEPKYSKPNYDLELLKDYAQNTYTREYFHYCGQRVFELAEYKNGKPHGAARLSLSYYEADYVHDFYCFFKNGLPHGTCFYHETYEDVKSCIEFDKGKIISERDFENMQYENIKKIIKKFKANKTLWKFMYDDSLDIYFVDLLEQKKS